MGWSKYGLIGVEAAMLETKFYGAPNLAVLMSHYRNTWSGPGGWAHCLMSYCRERTIRSIIIQLLCAALAPKKWAMGLKSRVASFTSYRLWYLLALLSLLLYIGLPLSGLTIELSDGYIHSNEPPLVVGRTPEDFHIRDMKAFQNNVEFSWNMGAPTTLPGIGIVYTTANVTRADLTGLRRTPNTIPLVPEVPEMFFAPQAEGPISGVVWGLRVVYNCSIIREYTGFTLLNKKSLVNRCAGGGWVSVDGDPCIFSDQDDDSGGVNLWSYWQLATNIGENQASISLNDFSRRNIVEYALWQVRGAASYEEVQNFNNSVEPTMRDVPSLLLRTDNGSWIINETFFGNDDFDLRTKHKVEARLNGSGIPLEVASPIGVRCSSSSILGTATVHAKTSTFDNFQALPASENVQTEQPVRSLGYTVAKVFASEVSLKIFNSINSRAAKAYSNSVSYDSFISSTNLQQSLLSAYALEALQMMYDGKYGFDRSWLHENLTSSREGKILSKGMVTPWISVICFGLWASICFTLSAVYGFRNRWSETLAGYDLFCFGVYSAVEHNPFSMPSNAPNLPHDGKWWSLPGLFSHLEVTSSEIIKARRFGTMGKREEL